MIEEGDSSGRGGNGTEFVASSRPLVLGRLIDLLLRRDALLLLAFEPFPFPFPFPLEDVGSSEPWYSEELVRETYEESLEGA